MSLQIGDKVKFLNEKGEGTIISFPDNKNACVLADDSFEYVYPLNELIKVNEEEGTLEFDLDREEIFNKIKTDHNKGSKSYKSILKKKSNYLNVNNVNSKGVVEVDLHLEELVHSVSSIKEWQKIDIQIDHFRECMNEAIERKISEIVFIHGKGQGRLKQELRGALNGYPGVEYFDADFNRYGFGATHVKIRGLYS